MQKQFHPDTSVNLKRVFVEKMTTHLFSKNKVVRYTIFVVLQSMWLFKRTKRVLLFCYLRIIYHGSTPSHASDTTIQTRGKPRCLHCSMKELEAPIVKRIMTLFVSQAPYFCYILIDILGIISEDRKIIYLR